MSSSTHVSVHDVDSTANVESRVNQSGAAIGTYARLTIDRVDIYTRDPIFLRKLANTASALAHELDLAVNDAEVPA